MKEQVKLSRAFGSTPTTVHKRVEYAFEIAGGVSTDGSGERWKPQGDRAEKITDRSIVRLLLIVVFAMVLLGLTALLLIEPQQMRWPEREAAKWTAGDVQIAFVQNVLLDKEVRATAYFSTSNGTRIRYFRHDSETLPDRFAVEADQGSICYVHCVLRWLEENVPRHSDLSSVKEEKKGMLSVMMSGECSEFVSEAYCCVTVVNVHADGTYSPEDVYYCEIPVL